MPCPTCDRVGDRRDLLRDLTAGLAEADAVARCRRYADRYGEPALLDVLDRVTGPLPLPVAAAHQRLTGRGCAA